LIVPLPDGEHAVGIVPPTSRRTRRRTSTSGGRTGRIGGAEYTLVDYNRGGTPLVEIVTAPDIHSAEEAKRFLQLLRQTIVELGISDAEMEKGTLRVDANVSVRPAGSDELRTRCEIKNMNSFTHIARGIEAEVERQIAVWESGGEVEQHTYDFDVATGTLTPRRAKEEADDYRYFPGARPRAVEPPEDIVDRLRSELPELPAQRIGRIGETLDHERALVLVTGGLDPLWEATVAAGADGVAASNVIANQLVGAGVDPGAVAANELAKLVEARDRIPRSAFDEAIGRVGEPGSPRSRTSRRRSSPTRRRWSRWSTRFWPPTPARWSNTVEARTAYSASSSGQVMKETKGQADPRAVNELVRAKLAG
jgi:aspartyl-tRNA(Asn)/glutamyl-tRNA(Gln) amidotransferase subunit B